MRGSFVTWVWGDDRFEASGMKLIQRYDDARRIWKTHKYEIWHEPSAQERLAGKPILRASAWRTPGVNDPPARLVEEVLARRKYGLWILTNEKLRLHASDARLDEKTEEVMGQEGSGRRRMVVMRALRGRGAGVEYSSRWQFNE
jgi:hypothetical protein